MVKGDTEGKIEKVVSKTAPKTQREAAQVRMEEGR